MAAFEMTLETLSLNRPYYLEWRLAISYEGFGAARRGDCQTLP